MAEIKEGLLKFIGENKLSPFSSSKALIKEKPEVDIFKTRDAKTVFNKVTSQISGYFCFSDTSNLLKFFGFTMDSKEIEKRQDFFKKIKWQDNSFLRELKAPKQWWKPKYGIVVVTSDEKTFLELQKLECPVQFINSQDDVAGLEDYDIIQVIDCNDFSSLLEQLPQTVFLNNMDEVYLERYLTILSGWKADLEILQKNKTSAEVEGIVSELVPLLKYLEEQPFEKISREHVEDKLDGINNYVSSEMKKITLGGENLFAMLHGGKMPAEVQQIVDNAIEQSKIPPHLFKPSIPVAIDEQELERYMKKQDAEEFTEIVESVKKQVELLSSIPEKLQELSNLLIYYDFMAGISGFMANAKDFPVLADELSFYGARNVFLDDKAQPISFLLNNENKCSILTGANSGGKTTLLEHIIQLITLLQLGMPVNGKVKIPIFTEVYYFAKTKGSSSKGAFENLLSQMSSIKPGKRTLILADEIESVTEPGVAGKIISATAEYFIEKGCFLVVATHLGHEIQKILPKYSRIDGIEAKGLNEKYELIVDHSPVLGKLANSTPELIVEKLASSKKDAYFKFINEMLKRAKKQ
jgi:hypothetical protein